MSEQDFTYHSTQSRSFRRLSPSQSLSLVWKKLNLTQQKHTFTNEKKCTTIQNKHRKLKPGLVASYDIQPRNGEGLVLFWRFTNLSLTYSLTQLITAQSPTFEIWRWRIQQLWTVWDNNNIHVYNWAQFAFLNT